MDDRATLLERLRIDRGDRVIRSRRSWKVRLGGAAVILAGAAGVWWWLLRPAGVPITIAIAAAAAEGATAETAGVPTLDASGYVVAQRQATVSAKTAGRLAQLFIQEGQKVRAGEIIARLDDSNTRAGLVAAQAQVVQARASVAAARTARDDATPIFQRDQRERAAGVISAQDFDSARATYDAAQAGYAVQQSMVEVAGANLAVAQRLEDDMTVRAPFAGVVTEKNAQEGEIVSPVSGGEGGFTRTGIATLVDMDSLEVDVDVSENFINRVQVGQAALIRLNAYPDWAIPANVIAIIPTADRSKATVMVRVGFKERDPRILPEMGARVSFLSSPSAAGQAGLAGLADQAVPAPRSGAPSAGTAVLPPAAIQASGDAGVVYVIKGDIVQRRSVKLLAHTAAGQTILSGLAPGTRVAVGDFNRLGDGTRISIHQ